MPSLIAITIIPPLIFSIYNPTIFFKALDFAGGICAVILFGIFPVLMVWNGRYKKKIVTSNYKVKGGKPILIIISLFATFIILFQLNTMLFK
jgi:tyrosine-specific transport protein